MKKTQLNHALRNLGPTPDIVAHKLVKAGAKGVRKSCRACPVTTYLYKQFQDELPILFSIDELSCSGIQPRNTIHVPTPKAVAAFLNRFDDGSYSELEAGE